MFYTRKKTGKLFIGNFPFVDFLYPIFRHCRLLPLKKVITPNVIFP